ncbi:M14 family metallopeptidase [Flagellimonas sp. CMM7]|nr:M14 family metallopeptidase [Flagellimonas sp. CMM7]
MRFSHSILVICLITCTVSCTGSRIIKFPNKVDTKDKPIVLQHKQVEFVTDVGVYVSNDFPGARLNNISVKNDSTLILRIQPENEPINNSAYFAFKTWTSNERDIYFQFSYPKGYKHRYIPKYETANRGWVQVDSTVFFIKDTIATLKFRVLKDTTLIAAQEVRTSQDVKDWYTGLTKKNAPTTRLKSIGKTHLGRDIPMMDIYKGSATNKDIIVLLTRQHPPEVTGYFAFQSFLETILQSGKLTDAFLEKYRVIAFPLMNPDGVDLGHWRHNAGGVDLNRDWGRYRQPEVSAVTNRIENIVKEQEVKVLLGVDFHSTWHDVFYTNVEREHTNLPNFVSDWFTQLEANIPNYKVNEKSAISTKPVSKGWFLKRFNAVGITYEIGDETPRDFITLKGKISAHEMMKLLTNSN